jgi:hypothetical protein
MPTADKIMLDCTRCGRKKRVLREPTDPPGLALMKTQCQHCNPGSTSPEYYFDAQGQEIDCDGALLIRQIPRNRGMIGPTLVIIGTWIIAVGLLAYFVAF